MTLQMELNKDRYLSLLEKLIGEAEFLQNNPPGFVPEEDRWVLRAGHSMYQQTGKGAAIFT